MTYDDSVGACTDQQKWKREAENYLHVIPSIDVARRMAIEGRRMRQHRFWLKREKIFARWILVGNVLDIIAVALVMALSMPFNRTGRLSAPSPGGRGLTRKVIGKSLTKRG